MVLIVHMLYFQLEKLLKNIIFKPAMIIRKSCYHNLKFFNGEGEGDKEDIPSTGKANIKRQVYFIK